MQAFAAGDHGVDVLVGFDVEIDDDRAVVVEHVVDGLGDVVFVVAADAADAEGFGQGGEVGVLHRGLAVAALVEEVLPLLDHALEVVVEDGDFHGDVVLGDGGQFAHGHEEAGVAVDVDDDFAGAAELCADGGGQAVAHGAQAAAGDHLAGTAPAVELGGPHLVLADAGGDDRFAVGLAVDFLDHVLRLGIFACRRNI